MSWVATASSNTVESRYRFRRPRKIPVCAITSAATPNTRSGRFEAAIRRQYTSADESNLTCVSDRPQASFHQVSYFSALFAGQNGAACPACRQGYEYQRLPNG